LNDIEKSGDSKTFIYSNQLTDNLTYLFEDLIFNICSLFDYVANFISYTILNRKLTDWISLTKAASSKSKNALNKSISAQQILEINKQFVSKLYPYRSDLIHKKSFYVPVDFSKSYGSGINHEIIIYCPPSLITKFHEIRQKKKEGMNISLNYISFWITNQSIIYLEILLLELRKDIEKYRKIRPEDEPIKFKK
jgi:hypothetical protein